MSTPPDSSSQLDIDSDRIICHCVYGSFPPKCAIVTFHLSPSRGSGAVLGQRLTHHHINISESLGAVIRACSKHSAQTMVPSLLGVAPDVAQAVHTPFQSKCPVTPLCRSVGQRGAPSSLGLSSIDAVKAPTLRFRSSKMFLSLQAFEISRNDCLPCLKPSPSLICLEYSTRDF